MKSKIFNFDKLTGELIGSSDADLDPIEQKVMIPANATLVEPPLNIVVGEVAVFDSKSEVWSVKKDNRGTVYLKANGSEEEYSELGDLPLTMTDKKPFKNSMWDDVSGSWVDDLNKLVELKKAEIDAAYIAARDVGVTYKAALFQSDEKSVQSLVKVLTALANSWVLPAGFVWVDAANVAHPATKAWLQGLNKAFGDHEATLFARKLQAKGALAAIDLTSPTAIADIQAVVF